MKVNPCAMRLSTYVHCPSSGISSTTRRNCSARTAPACDKAQAVVLDQVFFALDADKFRQFTELLDAPPGRNPGLERLKAVKAPWNTDPSKR
jgi:hypothetical protein